MLVHPLRSARAYQPERKFIDLPNSSLFYVREHEIVAS